MKEDTKILITGGTGLLGKSIVKSAHPACSIIATYCGNYAMVDNDKVKYHNLDILKSSGYSAIFAEFRPNIVIHIAGVGSPDYAQRYKEHTWAINVEGTAAIISNCAKVNSKLIHISSSCIYDGDKAPYNEESLAVPAHYYGEVKLKGEELVKKSGLTYAIIRPILMYGWNYAFERKNILSFALEKLKKNEEVDAFEDVYCNPIPASFCARAIWEIILRDAYDAFNIGGLDTVSVFDLVREASHEFGFDQKLVKPVKQGFFKDFIRRPRDTSCRTDKVEKFLGLRPLSLGEGLKIMRQEERQVKDA